MLNPDLHLNEEMFSQEVELAATRDGYGKGLMALAEQHPEVVVLSADLTESTRSEAFAKAYPERFFEIGVAEQNMASVAAGLAVTGKIPFIASYATFSPGKNWETLRTTAVYNQANVKIAGHHAGIMTGPDGATHQATEDVAITRCLPGMTVVVPCDSVEAMKATVAAGEMTGPVYLRYTRDKTPVMTTEQTPFFLGKVAAFWIEEQPEVVIVAMGYMLHYALMAAKELATEGVMVTVVNVPTIKPMDVKGLLKLTKEAMGVVSVEDHQVMGGLGSAVAEVLAQYQPRPMAFVGLQDTFAESGEPKELVEKYGMGVESIKAAVKRIVHKT